MVDGLVKGHKLTFYEILYTLTPFRKQKHYDILLSMGNRITINFWYSNSFRINLGKNTFQSPLSANPTSADFA